MPPSRPISPEELLRHSGWVRALARGLLRDADAAEDVVQSTWVAALSGGGKEGPALPGWLARVTRNFARKRLRSDARRELHEGLAARSAAEPSAADLYERAALHRELVEAVMSLDEPYRSTILLRYFEELAPRAIASREAIPVCTVKTRLARGLEKLRAHLDARSGGDRTAWVGALAAFVRNPFAVGAGTTALAIMTTNLKLLAAGTLLAALLAAMFVWKARMASAPQRLALSAAAAPSRPLDEVSAAPRLAAESTGEPERSSGTEPRPGAHAAPSAEPLDPDRDLHGVVTDSGGRPLLGACIEIRRSESRGFQLMESDPELDSETLVAATASDERGEFRVRLPGARPFDLHASLAGYAERQLPSRFAGEEVRVVLTAGCTIFGRITRKPDNAPCAGAVVHAVAGVIHPGGSPEFRTESDEDGLYRLVGLPAEDLEIDVDARDAVTRWGIVMRGVECAELHRDFVLEAGVRVAGVVSDSETGLPIEGVEILLGRPGSPSNGRTDADGRYALRIAREEAGFRDSLRAIASGFAVGEHEVQAFSDDPIRLDFQLRRGRSAKGRVLGPDDRPVSGAIVIAKGWGMESIDPVSDRCRVRTAADGTFEIPNLAEAAHHWLFLRKEGCGTKAFDFPHDEASRTSIDFGDLRLPEPATILAEIVDEEGKGIADILVGLDGANSDHDRFGLVNQYLAGTLSRMARSDDRGRVGFSDLAAGTYTLRVNGAFASRGNPYSELRVDEGESREGVRLVLRLGLAIEGRVVDPSGGPVPGVSVMCIRERSGQDPAEFEDAEDVARGDGSFRLRGLREGKYTLLVSTILPPGENGAGDLASARWRSISAGASGLSLTLPVAAWIEGKVVGTDGAPVAGAHIQSEGVEDEDADVFAPTSAAETDAQGRFRLRVGAGSRGNLQAYVRGEFFAEAKDVRAGAQGVVLRPSSPR